MPVEVQNQSGDPPHTFFCESCAFAKATRAPIPEERQGGRAAAGLRIRRRDDHTRIKPLRSNNETFDTYENYEAWARTQTNGLSAPAASTPAMHSKDTRSRAFRNRAKTRQDRSKMSHRAAGPVNAQNAEGRAVTRRGWRWDIWHVLGPSVPSPRNVPEPTLLTPTSAALAHSAFGAPPNTDTRGLQIPGAIPELDDSQDAGAISGQIMRAPTHLLYF
ncbi:hypothetical protein GGX14DRAFT_578270 [Mycena pura]|uniref:Uncharacterized protein n=1 Tax=Mycena pura TaxID=153505 RepID=A0AAD6UT44_9AGAR|nr:hypothetical protein GGX14DRAFT_578270 [Mycena pura]